MTQKLVLKIKEKGKLIQLPGSRPPFRTPAEIDVTNIPLNSLILIMNNYNVQDYEITSFSKDKQIVYKKKKNKDKAPSPSGMDDGTKQYLKSLNKRFNRMENLIASMFNRTAEVHQDVDQEELKDRLDRIEQLITDHSNVKEVVYSTKEKTSGDPRIEELDEDLFIPTVDISGMTLKSSEHSEVQREEDSDETADLLSQMTKKKKLED